MRNKLVLLIAMALSSCAAKAWSSDYPGYRARRLALSQKTNGGIVLVFAASVEDGASEIGGFRQNPNFSYLTGWNEPGAALVIVPAVPAEGSKRARTYEEILFLPARSASDEQWTGPKLGPENPAAVNRTGVDRVMVLDSLRSELSRLLAPSRSVLYTELTGVGQKSSAGPLEWLARANAFSDYNTDVNDITPLLATMRVVKDTGEIDRIRHAIDASVAAHEAAWKAIQPGITEREISALMQYEFEKRGCERPAYPPIVGAGSNSTVLHYDDDSSVAQAGDVIVMDVGGEYGGYAADITRTVPANGRFTPRQRELYEVVLGAEQAAFDAFQTGKFVINSQAPNSLTKVAYDYINSHGSDLHGQPLGKYFVHGLSHYIGLKVHDVGDTNIPLDKGMVFTLEPGIYIPEEKIGIRVEDMVWVDPTGKLVLLTGALSRRAEEVEGFMQK